MYRYLCAYYNTGGGRDLRDIKILRALCSMMCDSPTSIVAREVLIATEPHTHAHIHTPLYKRVYVCLYT